MRFDADKLALLGWSAPRRPSALEAPGQVRLLTAHLPGEGRLRLTWGKPVEGGKPSAYRILRRERPEGPWRDAAVAVATEISLRAEPRGVELEYRVLALNRTGPGQPSNTVVVLL